MSIDDRIKEIRDRLEQLGPVVDRQSNAQPGPAPMTNEIAEAEKLKLELAELQHSYLKRPNLE